MNSAAFLEVANQVAAQRSDLLRTNTFAACAEFVRLVAQAINVAYPAARAGLLSKSGGEQGYTWPNGARTSHDVIAFPDGSRADVLGNASDGEIANGGKGGAASVKWDEIPPHEWRPANVWVSIDSVGATGGTQPGGGTHPEPQPEPKPQPTPCKFDPAIVARLNTIDGGIGGLNFALADLAAQVKAIADRVEENLARTSGAIDEAKQVKALLENPPAYSGRVLGQSFTLSPRK